MPKPQTVLTIIVHPVKALSCAVDIPLMLTTWFMDRLTGDSAVNWQDPAPFL
jgi:hypothetical protein